MRVVITGATGNVGTALIERLVHDSQVETIVGVARRIPPYEQPNVVWRQADVAEDDLSATMRETDVVVHLAWQIQPGRDVRELWRVNIGGSRNVFDAAAAAQVRGLVYASSVGAYSPAPDRDEPVSEDHPTDGIPSSSYARQKAYVERLLDAFELAHPQTRVVRLRPALTFQRSAATEVRRLFLGSLFPNRVATRAPVLPDVQGLRFQAVHADDVAEAYRLVLHHMMQEAWDRLPSVFNIAAPPTLTLQTVAELIGARTVRVPQLVVRPAAALTWWLRLHPVEPGWVDLALNAPLMDTRRARGALGWKPQRTARHALAELLNGIAAGAGHPTPPLQGDAPRRRLAELSTGQGQRYSPDPRTE